MMRSTLDVRDVVGYYRLGTFTFHDSAKYEGKVSPVFFVLVRRLTTSAKRLNKKCILSLRSPSKCSFTPSKLRFFGLRKPKTTSFIQPLDVSWPLLYLSSMPTSAMVVARSPLISRMGSSLK